MYIFLCSYTPLILFLWIQIWISLQNSNLSRLLTIFVIVYHGCTLFSEPNTETSGEDLSLFSHIIFYNLTWRVNVYIFMQLYAPDIFSIFKPVLTMIDYFSADNNSSFNENTRYPSSGPYRNWHFPKSDHFNLHSNLSRLLTIFVIVYHECTLFSEPNTETSSVDLFLFSHIIWIKFVIYPSWSLDLIIFYI
jgi:hypothetical protein